MRNKFLTKILGTTLGIAMAIGVGVGVANYNKTAQKLDAYTSTTEFELVTSTSQLVAGAKYIMGATYNNNNYFVNKTSNANNRLLTTASISANNRVVVGNNIMPLTLGGSAGAWTFATNDYGGTDGYFNTTNTTSKNYLKIVADLDNYAYFSINITNNDATITCTGKSSRNIIYLYRSSQIAAYSEQTTGTDYFSPRLYKEVPITQTVSGETAGTVGIGVVLSTNASSSTSWSFVSNTAGATLSASTGASVTVHAANAGTVTVKAECDGYTDATHTIVFSAPAGQCVVSFDLNAPSNTTTPASIENQIVDENDYAVEPSPAPTRESSEDYNYTFAGWFTDQNADPNNDVPFDFEHTPINADLPLYAVWNEIAKPASQKIEERLATRSALTYNTSVVSEATLDVLTRETTSVANEDQTYPAWSNKTATSTAVYAGCSSGDKDSIQLRSKNSNSGVITTASGGNAKKITVVWQGDTMNGRTLNVYGKNTAYTDATELYDAETQGTLLGTIVKGTSTSLTFATAYPFVGFRSNDGAMYLSSVTIQWGESEYSFTNVKAKFGGYVTKALWDELNAESPIQGYGVMISTTDVDPVGYIRDKHFKSEYATAIELAEGNIDNAIGLVCNGTKILNFAKSGTPYLHEAANEANYTEDTYAWNLVQSINSDHLERTYVAVAYIRTNAGLVFLEEERISVKDIAARMISSGDYDESPLYGSLNYLANL